MTVLMVLLLLKKKLNQEKIESRKDSELKKPVMYRLFLIYQPHPSASPTTAMPAMASHCSDRYR